ncbi:hypothetical protein V6N11_048583 [Hibiscus sabdariffa]|uniref:Uncharacterized protein n=1 Tax=Hibiscus sabdariffa TaxID=183260 RepID=A0ABR2PVS5_9ROSI
MTALAGIKLPWILDSPFINDCMGHGPTAGAVLQDPNGDWIVGNQRYIGISKILPAELSAVMEDLNIARHRVYKKLQFDSNAITHRPWSCLTLLRVLQLHRHRLQVKEKNYLQTAQSNEKLASRIFLVKQTV